MDGERVVFTEETDPQNYVRRRFENDEAAN
jgi:hypothetical protein